MILSFKLKELEGFLGAVMLFAGFCGMSRNEEEVETTFFPQIFICTVSRRHKRICCFRELTKNNGSLENTGRSKTRETTQDYHGLCSRLSLSIMIKAMRPVKGLK